MTHSRTLEQNRAINSFVSGRTIVNSSPVQRIGNVSRTAIAFLLILFIGILYVSQSTASANFAGPLASAQDEHDKLLRENQALEAQVAELKSVEAIQAGSKDLGLVAAPKPEFANKN